MSDHHFNPKIAEKFGVYEAIFINNLEFWIKHNQANKKHYHDGRYWSFNSYEAFSELFPYFSPSQVKRIIKRCVDFELIKKGNYNKKGYDKTNWYAFTDSALLLLGIDTKPPKTAETLNGRNRPIDETESPDLYHIQNTYKKHTTTTKQIPAPKPQIEKQNPSSSNDFIISEKFDSAALKLKSKSDTRCDDIFLKNVNHHIENNSDKKLSLYQRARGALSILRQLKSNNMVFCSHGFIDLKAKAEKIERLDREEKEKARLQDAQHEMRLQSYREKQEKTVVGGN